MRLDRRLFVAGGISLAAAASPLVQGGLAWGQLVNSTGSLLRDPMQTLRGRNWPSLVAYIETQLLSLADQPIDSPELIAGECIEFISYMEPQYQEIINATLTWINAYAVNHAGQRFYHLSAARRQELFNQGETPCGRFPPIRWESDVLLHTAVSILTTICRAVICSRPTAHRHIGMVWTPGCTNPTNLVHLPPPEYPNVAEEYDVCVIGSGAGGSVIACRAAEQGLRVLIIEDGQWVSPDELALVGKDEVGQPVVMPPRGDHSLMKLYKGAGVQIASDVTEETRSLFDAASPSSRRKLKPFQTVNLIQARVVGGGPYINNAIHVEMEPDAWQKWQGRQPSGMEYADLKARMQQVNQELGVNVEATTVGAGVRGTKFVECGNIAGVPIEPLPVAILPGGLHCGSDNSVDPVGDHTGGLHPYRQRGPNSYFMRALHAKVPAKVAYGMRGIKFQLTDDTAQAPHARYLLAEDRRATGEHVPGPRHRIKAHTYVIAAGVGPSTKILADSVEATVWNIPGLGERLTGNVFSPVYALYDQPLFTGATERPEPGITQCYYVKKHTVQHPDGSQTEEPTLENWFHFPGTLALGLTGWFNEWTRVMRMYNHLAVCGMVIPTAVRPTNHVGLNGQLRLEIDQEEFELLLRGMEKIGRIYLAGTTPSNGVSLHLATKAVLLDAAGQPLKIRNYAQLMHAIAEIRRRGPAFLNLATAHPQGGNSLGTVVNPATMKVMVDGGADIDNLYVADASIFPAGCEVNPQLTINALAHCVADRMLAAAEGNQS